MPQVVTWLLGNVFTALLPPLDKEEEDFFTILGLERDATNEQIRKAYKVLSLKLHPDKVAQRNELNAQDAAARYEKVQEAYGVLVNSIKRQKYAILKFSPTRYRFVNQGAYTNPGAMYENLTKASKVDKSRLVILFAVIIMIIFLQPVLIASKVNQILEGDGALEPSGWITLLIPTWIMGGIWVLLYCLLTILSPGPEKIPMTFLTVEYMLWYIGVVMLAIKWDEILSISYLLALTPMYLAMIVRWISKGVMMAKIQSDVSHMVSMDYLERDVLKGTPLPDLSEEEQEKIRQTYIIVTVSPDFVPDLDSINNKEGKPSDENAEVTDQDNIEDKPCDEKDEPPIDQQLLIELQKVESSPEYEAALDLYYSIMGSLIGSFVFGLAFMINLTLKLDRNIEASYWIVFIPVWIHCGARWVFNFLKCACGTLASDDDIIMEMELTRQTAENEGGEDDAGTGDDTKNKNDIGGGSRPMGPSDRPKDSDFMDPLASISSLPSNGPAEKVVASKNASSKPSKEIKSNATPVMKAEEKKESDGGGADPDQFEAIDLEQEGVNVDEETFREWQSAYQEAEEAAVEENAKAAGECISLSVQLILLTTVVAKIEDGYWANDGSDGYGFNTFWILFPFLLFFGFVLCCCACLIYGAEPAEASDLNVDDDAVLSENPSSMTTAAEPIIMTPSPPSEPTKVTTAAAATSTGNTPESSTGLSDIETGAQQQPSADMEDLD